ncbi:MULTISPECIES: TRL-like family protein [Butyricimonas]|nr:MULTISPECIES: TRL-like family protein [Butyricimonas]MCB6972423.1 TRL-like family protein [Butyricimonas synergistica]MCG4519431.1 TRL-like family protein [Butyricimonas sp. DFI.6.44]
MKSIKRLLLLVVVAAGMSSCASLSSQAGMGAIYMDVQTGEHVTSNPLGSKVGTASVNNILGVYLSGDASIQAAAKSAGIKKISHVDSQKKSILGIFSTYKVMVYGE